MFCEVLLEVHVEKVKARIIKGYHSIREYTYSAMTLLPCLLKATKSFCPIDSLVICPFPSRDSALIYIKRRTRKEFGIIYLKSETFSQ